MENQTKVKMVRRKYDEGFKTEALRMVTNGRSVPDVARSLGISENILYKWQTEQKPRIHRKNSVGMPRWNNFVSNYDRLKWSGIF